MKHPCSHSYRHDHILNAEKARIHAQLEYENRGQQRDVLERELRQVEIARHIDSWISSPGLQPPKSISG